MFTIRKIQSEVHKNSRNKGFWKEVEVVGRAGRLGHRRPVYSKKCIPEKLALIHSEISEALEDFREGWPVNEVRLNLGKPEGFGVELADAVIRILDLAEALDIPLDKLIRQKHAYNVTRPYMHGRTC